MISTAPGAVDSPVSACAALFVGTVMHTRMKPVTHRFNYRVFTTLINLDRLDELDRLSPVFSVNRFNLFSFYPSDHGLRDGSSLALYARTLLRDAGTHDPINHVFLLCYPRMLGYVFNPLSVYFAYAADKRLLGVIYEVRNTFGEHHTYVAAVQPGELTVSGLRQERVKRLYVSPFNGLAMRYLFRLCPPDKSVAVRILAMDTDGPVLAATFFGRHATFSTAELIFRFLTIPLMSIKIITGIHFEALRLWVKGLRMVRRSEAPDAVSYGDENNVRQQDLKRS
ncbi:MAG: DUF1365 domain-containing protein [Hyphomicrobiales bacterium]